MKQISLHFYNGRRSFLNVDDLEFIDYGGQGRLYTYDYMNRKFLLKIILDDSSVFARLNAFHKAFHREKIQDCLWYRGFPIAYGYCSGDVFEFDKSEKISYLYYNYLEGHSLADELKVDEISILETGIIPDFSQRKALALKTLDCLVLLEERGIIHNDLKPENFLIRGSDKKLFLIDLEGAGLWNYEKNEAVPQPVSRNDRFVLPPPEIYFDRNPSIFTERWTGLNLIWWILTGTNHPFLFAGKIDKNTLDNLYSFIDKSKEPLLWPPKISEGFKYYHPDYSFADYGLLFKKYFNDAFGKCLFNTYIRGYLKPQARTSFVNLKIAINSL